MADIVDLFDDGGPGRSRITKQPSARTRARVERHRAALEEHAAHDQVLKVARKAATLEALYVARSEIAAEAAALLWSRLQQRPGAREIGRTASRRVSALSEVGRLTLEIARADPGAPSAAMMKRACLLLLSEIEIAAAEIFDENTTARLAKALRERMDEAAIDALIAQP